jgi:hypothetical protein
VWDVLTDFSAYREWNPYMEIEGSLRVGAKLTVRMGADRGRGRGMVFKPAVLAASPGEELRWLGKLGLGGVVDGEHFFILERNADGSTHLTHGERYSGVLVALAKPFLNKERNQAGYEGFNQVLKQRVESVRAEEEDHSRRLFGESAFLGRSRVRLPADPSPDRRGRPSFSGIGPARNPAFWADCDGTGMEQRGRNR